MGVWDGVAGAAIGAAGSLAGGLLSTPATTDTGFAREMWRKNYEAQKEFAQNGIRWKVDDAKAAGLHPLAALGTGSMFSPSASAGDVSPGQDYSWLSDMGQGIGRAVEAKMTAEERAKNELVNDEVTALKLENMRLQNEQIKLDMASQLARDVSASGHAVRSSGLPPAMPSLRTRADGATIGNIMPGQGDSTSSSLFQINPAEIVASDPTRPHQEAGSVPEVMFARTSDGGYAPIFSQSTQEQYEDDLMGKIGWWFRNRIVPSFWDTLGSPPPDSFLPSGHDRWHYAIARQAWYPVKKDKSLWSQFLIGY